MTQFPNCNQYSFIIWLQILSSAYETINISRGEVSLVAPLDQSISDWFHSLLVCFKIIWQSLKCKEDIFLNINLLLFKLSLVVYITYVQ